ncbi:hypothetical protein POTOM_006850 [Populus tomentosa]|uniref:Apple domain-containing protein n=1 Tax=Populus tomentosa TaxID=118781 RepID=A0A8X8DFF8_POPTO|nr:hypothetical protein POTOM_006850 [Populus tomentosa]
MHVKTDSSSTIPVSITLGFARIGSDEDNASYSGIRHSNGTRNPFWLANRDKPVADNSGEGPGCVRWNAGPACKRSNRDKYELLSGYFDYKFPITVDDNASLSISDCMDRCWKNCSCVGIDSRGENYAYYTGCILFHGSFTADPSGRSAGPYVIKKQTNPSGLDIKDRRWLWILAAVGTVLIMVLAGILMYLRRRRLREKFHNNTTNDIYELENDGNKDESRRELLDWKKRFEIIEEIAQGLLYHHKYSDRG